jgi:predicted dehydrogenase
VYAPNSGAEVAEQFAVTAAQTEGALFETTCDAIYVASPVNCHLSQVIRAAQAGKHILCEKPLALNVAEASEMVRACD